MHDVQLKVGDFVYRHEFTKPLLRRISGIDGDRYTTELWSIHGRWQGSIRLPASQLTLANIMYHIGQRVLTRSGDVLTVLCPAFIPYRPHIYHDKGKIDISDILCTLC